MKYRKKPIEIDARKVTKKRVKFIAKWCRSVAHSEGITIYTLEGRMLARFGDWIIRGVNGEFYPCKPDIFEKTYERVEENR